MGFSQKVGFSVKTHISTDKMSSSLINPVILRKRILSAHADKWVYLKNSLYLHTQIIQNYLHGQIIWVFSDRLGLSERNLLYLQIM